jgi:hypothetical protein
MEESGNRVSERDLAINLSYVLHEPSDSAAVASAMRDARQRRYQVTRAVRALDSLPNDALRARTTLTPRLADALASGSTLDVVYTTHTGAWPILERLLHLCAAPHAGGAFTRTTELVLLDGLLSDERRESTCSFFRGVARLATALGPSSPGTTAAGYIAAVVRPGDESIMLSGGIAGASDVDSCARCAIPTNVLRLAESHVRDFLAQWQPPRTLWDEAAEITLPEMMALRET